MTTLSRMFTHRGASSLTPENTIAVFLKAMEIGARWFEFDVDTIADRTLIIVHDNRLDRTTNGKGEYYTRSFFDTHRFDAGTWFSDTYRFERIPEATDAISLGNKQHMRMNLEIKPCRGGAQLCERLIETLAVMVDSAYDKNRLVVSSFDCELLTALYKVHLQTSLGWFFDSERQLILGWQEDASAPGYSTVHSDAKGLAKEEVWKIRDYGSDCSIWTVNDLEQAKELTS